ncbi:MAG: hypothetical protein K8S23_13000 [Candidatus Cloacimonetes bacterium]|nr:hypothetical protein [Candidatus Cloacimonadota bacterium]
MKKKWKFAVISLLFVLFTQVIFASETLAITTIDSNTGPSILSLPSVTTGDISYSDYENIMEIHVNYSEVTSNGGENVIARGVCWGLFEEPDINNSNVTNDGSGIGFYCSDIYDVPPDNDYYIRAYATNASGTAYGEEDWIYIPPLQTIPEVYINYTANNITSYSATAGGYVEFEGNSPVTARGVCWSTSLNPDISGAHSNDGSGVGSFSSLMYPLVPNTTYYYKAYATNDDGTGYGSTYNFMTLTGSPSHFISGTITGANEVIVNLTGTTSSQTITDSNGFYLFLGLPAAGNYTVTPSLPGYTFNPIDRSYTNLTSNQIDQNFVATAPPTYSISGTITGTSSVTVNLTGDATQTTTTDGSGNYSFSGLSAGTYSVTPLKVGYDFSPMWYTYYLTSNQTGQDFTATLSTYTVTGNISGASSVPVYLTGDTSLNTITDASGNYSFPNLPTGNYTITPTLNGYTFNPISRSISNLSENQYNLDFVATFTTLYSISGTISICPLPASIWLRGSLSQSIMTDSLGFYLFSNLPTGNYTTYPVEELDTRFNPSSRSYPNLSSNQENQDFVGYIYESFVIHGTITGASSVTVDLSGEPNQQVVTNENGVYTFTVELDSDCTVTPSKAGFIFSPTSRSYSSIDEDFYGQNYHATTEPTLDAPVNVNIFTENELEGVSVVLSWTAVDGATSYEVWSCTNPAATFPDGWTMESTVSTTEYVELSTAKNKFFRVVAKNED